MIQRRQLLTGLVSLVAAPAIVRASSLMPISAAKLAVEPIPDWWPAPALNPLNPWLPDLLARQLIDGLCFDGLWGKLDSLYVPYGDRMVDVKQIFS